MGVYIYIHIEREREREHDTAFDAQCKCYNKCLLMCYLQVHDMCASTHAANSRRYSVGYSW